MARIELLDLNDDVLRIIFSHIPFILNVALTCRRFHDLAIENIIAVVWITTTERLRRLCKYALSPPHYRAVYIKHLSVSTKTPEDKAANDKALDAAALLGRLLEKAQNIRTIEINRFAGIMKKSSLARKSLGTMPYLTEATFGEINEVSLSVLPSLKHLRTLTLYFEGSPALEALVMALAACPSLRKLTLRAKPSLGLPPKEIPLITSLQELTLYSCSSRVLELINVCPNLLSLVINGIERAKGAELRAIEQFPPKLHSMHISELPHFSLVGKSCIPGAVQYLHIGEDWNHGSVVYLDDEDNARQIRHVLALIRAASPVGLRICLCAPLQPSSFWTNIASVASRLRFLDIWIQLTSGSPAVPDASWTNLLLDSLRGLPLVCLQLYLPMIETDMQHLTYNSWEESLVYSDPEEARRVYLQRYEEDTARVTAHCQGVVQAMLVHTQDLPEKLANALPNLKYLAFRTDVVASTHHHRNGVMASVYKWYKAVTHGEVKTMVTIPSQQGESIWETLKDGDLSVAENIQ